MNLATLRSVESHIGEDGLTWSLLLDLLGHYGKGGKYRHQNFDDKIGYGLCRRNRGIDIKTIEEVFDSLEQVDQSIIVVCADVSDRLVCFLTTICA